MVVPLRVAHSARGNLCTPSEILRGSEIRSGVAPVDNPGDLPAALAGRVVLLFQCSGGSLPGPRPPEANTSRRAFCFGVSLPRGSTCARTRQGPGERHRLRRAPGRAWGRRESVNRV